MSKSSAYNKSANAPAELFETPLNASGAPAWKQEVNERLAAHRNRRGGSTGVWDDSSAESPKTARARAAAAAARVAARYAKAPSYSELLAGEARAVVRAAGAAAEAARNAQAAAQAVLTGLEFGPDFGPQLGQGTTGFWEPAGQAGHAHFDTAAPAVESAAPARWQDEPPVVARERETPWAGAQPRWEEALPANPQVGGVDVWSEMRLHSSPRTEDRQDIRQGYDESREDGELLAEEFYGASIEPMEHIPANLIEFPRELVATRKARPRLAEGPLYDSSHSDAQLSIFEVDPELLAPPIVLNDPHAVAPPEWASIRLDSPSGPEGMGSRPHEAADAEAHAEHFYAAPTQVVSEYAEAGPAPTYHVEPLAIAAQHAEVKAAPAWNSAAEEVERSGEPLAELLVASLSDRLLAGLVDGALVTLAFLAAAVVVIASTEHPPTGKIALVAAGCGLLLFSMLYQFLFLSYAEEGTPGMRYARIALCTFDDDNPTREQMRKRIPATLLSALPAGLGLIWAAVDGQNLGWHDRMTRTYQRKY